MYRITGTIQGVAPLLFGAPTTKTIEDLRGSKGGGRFTEDERMLEALQRVHQDERGIFIPKWNFKKCLLEGCQRANLKEGRASMMPYLKATVFPEDDLLLGKRTPDDILEVMGKRPPRTGGACLIKYPSFKTGWQAHFVLTIVDDRRSVEHIRRALEEAGTLVGLGAWRPEYGRFVLTEWSGKLPLNGK